MGIDRLRKFLRLTRHDQRLLAGAALLLVAVRLGLSLVPFLTLRVLPRRLARTADGPCEIDQACIDKVVWAVLVAGHYVPGIRCLPRALAIQFLLLRRGYPAALRIGVSRGERRELSAHAWVEIRGHAVGGLANPLHYTLLPPL